MERERGNGKREKEGGWKKKRKGRKGEIRGGREGRKGKEVTH